MSEHVNERNYPTDPVRLQDEAERYREELERLFSDPVTSLEVVIALLYTVRNRVIRNCIGPQIELAQAIRDTDATTRIGVVSQDGSITFFARLVGNGYDTASIEMVVIPHKKGYCIESSGGENAPPRLAIRADVGASKT